ncbi:hypothetical protein SKAU_G00232690 [Synaphobranchus kaupii]|uniref:Uncharacterized protein n=1 Tax=Synaphobranchus kaupii TaxID=118154 RepID=A0A9Q1F630_SYNKA|nr:hypothetical protein SKAU_G00232690 [Synaphobranchus kaupii]
MLSGPEEAVFRNNLGLGHRHNGVRPVPGGSTKTVGKSGGGTVGPPPSAPDRPLAGEIRGVTRSRLPINDPSAAGGGAYRVRQGEARVQGLEPWTCSFSRLPSLTLPHGAVVGLFREVSGASQSHSGSAGANAGTNGPANTIWEPLPDEEQAQMKLHISRFAPRCIRALPGQRHPVNQGAERRFSWSSKLGYVVRFPTKTIWEQPAQRALAQ